MFFYARMVLCSADSLAIEAGAARLGWIPLAAEGICCADSAKDLPMERY